MQILDIDFGKKMSTVKIWKNNTGGLWQHNTNVSSFCQDRGYHHNRMGRWWRFLRFIPSPMGRQ